MVVCSIRAELLPNQLHQIVLSLTVAAGFKRKLLKRISIKQNVYWTKRFTYSISYMCRPIKHQIVDSVCRTNKDQCPNTAINLVL